MGATAILEQFVEFLTAEYKAAYSGLELQTDSETIDAMFRKSLSVVSIVKS